MVDVSPLREAEEECVDIFDKKMLNLALDLIDSGHVLQFKQMFQSGEHSTFMSPLACDAVSRVMKKLTENKQESWTIVCALPAIDNLKEEVVVTEEQIATTKRKRDSKLPRFLRQSQRAANLRRFYGIGAKIQVCKEEQEKISDGEKGREEERKKECEQRKREADMLDKAPSITEEEVEEIHQVFLNYLKQIPSSVLERELHDA